LQILQELLRPQFDCLLKWAGSAFRGCPISARKPVLSGWGGDAIWRFSTSLCVKCQLSLHSPIDSRAGDTEQLGKFSSGMSAGLVHFHQMTLLRGRQLGLLATQMTFGFGHLHPLARSSADEIGFELCHHRQNIEEKPPNWVGRVMDGALATFRLGAEFTLVGVIFAVAMMLSSRIYQFAIWKREGLLPGVSLRRLVYLSFMNPQYLRALYREHLRSLSRQT
jgi:hypothetical protein